MQLLSSSSSSLYIYRIHTYIASYIYKFNRYWAIVKPLFILRFNYLTKVKPHICKSVFFKIKKKQLTITVLRRLKSALLGSTSRWLGAHGGSVWIRMVTRNVRRVVGGVWTNLNPGRRCWLTISFHLKDSSRWHFSIQRRRCWPGIYLTIRVWGGQLCIFRHIAVCGK